LVEVTTIAFGIKPLLGDGDESRNAHPARLSATVPETEVGIGEPFCTAAG